MLDSRRSCWRRDFSLVMLRNDSAACSFTLRSAVIWSDFEINDVTTGMTNLSSVIRFFRSGVSAS